jgi:hypothetical protein
VKDRWATGKRVRMARNQTQDFIAPHRLPRIGTVENRDQRKVAYATGEDVAITLDPSSHLNPGDRATLVDDREPVFHPVTRQPQGYYVQVLGHLRVLSVAGGRAVARLVETYHPVEDGAGVMAYVAPRREIEIRPGIADVEGVVLGGSPGETLLGEEQVIFLDRGSLQRLEPGVIVDVPARGQGRSAQGMVDLVSPMGRVLVVSVQDNTSTGVIVESRLALEAGDRFVGAPLQP